MKQTVHAWRLAMAAFAVAALLAVVALWPTTDDAAVVVVVKPQPAACPVQHQ